MDFLSVGLAGAAFLLISGFFLCVLLTPTTLIAYLLYGVGWLIVGHGINIWGFRLNGSYTIALYPFAYYAHWLLWRVWWRSTQFRNSVVEVVGKVVSFMVVALFFVGVWYMLGLGLEHLGLSIERIDLSPFDSVQHLSDSYFALALEAIVAVAYLGVSVKILSKLIRSR
jgi:hypothetical protein